MQNFLAMGGYAPYVWSCYGLTSFALVAIALSARAVYQRELKAARRRTVASETNVEGVSA